MRKVLITITAICSIVLVNFSTALGYNNACVSDAEYAYTVFLDDINKGSQPTSFSTSSCTESPDSKQFSILIVGEYSRPNTDENFDCNKFQYTINENTRLGGKSSGYASSSGNNVNYQCTFYSDYNTLYVHAPSTTTPTPDENQRTHPTADPNAPASSPTTSPVHTLDPPIPAFNDFGSLIKIFFAFIPAVITLLLFTFLAIGSMKILTAGADDKKKADGIKTITNAIMGIVVVVLSLTIIVMLQAVLGLKLLF